MDMDDRTRTYLFFNLLQIAYRQCGFAVGRNTRNLIHFRSRIPSVQSSCHRTQRSDSLAFCADRQSLSPPQVSFPPSVNQRIFRSLSVGSQILDFDPDRIDHSSGLNLQALDTPPLKSMCRILRLCFFRILPARLIFNCYCIHCQITVCCSLLMVLNMNYPLVSGKNCDPGKIPAC